MGGTVCLDNTLCPTVFLGKGSLVGRCREMVQVSHLQTRARGRIRTEESCAGNAAVSPSLRIVNLAHGLFSYPVAYSFVILPVSIARWLEFSNKSSSSAATFFGVSMHNLSGAINVLLTLIVRPQLLLLTRPDQSEVDTGSAHFSDTAESKHSPQPIATGLMDRSSRISATPSRTSAGRRSVDI